MIKSRATLNQVLSLMTVAFNELAIGLADGWIAATRSTLESSNDEFYITKEEFLWILCLVELGKLGGAVYTACELDELGRRVMLRNNALIFFLMWVAMMFTRPVLILYLLGSTYGFFVGSNDVMNTTYLAENSSPAIRGVFGAVCVTLYHIGKLFEFIIATHFPYSNTITINTAVTFLTYLSVLWIKEPVQFLIMKRKYGQAKRTLAWLHGTNVCNEDVKQQFEQIKKNVQMENFKKSSFKRSLMSSANCKSLFIIVTISALMGTMEYTPVMDCIFKVFSASKGLTQDEFTILLGIAQILVVATTIIFISRFNRRTMILISLSLITLAHVVTTGLYYVNSSVMSIPHFPWLVLMSTIFYACIYVFVSPVIFVIRGELFPLSIKGVGGCLSVIVFSATNFLTTKIFHYIWYRHKIEINFLFLALIAHITFLFVYIFLPETKNKSLIEIQKILEKNKYSFF